MQFLRPVHLRGPFVWRRAVEIRLRGRILAIARNVIA
jgi:hypothetical protein